MPAFFLTIIYSCGDDGDDSGFQSDMCNGGDKATLSLDIEGWGFFTYVESDNSVSHASNTEGDSIDAISMYIRWEDLATGNQIYFDVTVEHEGLEVTTYSNNPIDFNGSVNFYIYDAGGTLQDHYTFVGWETTINGFGVHDSSTNGGLTSTRLSHVDASTSGTLTKVGDGSINYPFTANYTICAQW